MTPRDYLETIARPNVDEFAAAEYDLRKAVNAVQAVFALSAHIHRAAGGRAATGAVDAEGYRAYLAGRSPDFQTLRDIAGGIRPVILASDHRVLVQSDMRSVVNGPDRPRAGWAAPAHYAAVVTNRGDLMDIDTILINSLTLLEREIARYALS